MIGIAIVEGLILGTLGLIAGVFLGLTVAQVIGKARSFLDFSLDSNLRVGLTTQTLYFGLAAIGYDPHRDTSRLRTAPLHKSKSRTRAMSTYR